MIARVVVSAVALFGISAGLAVAATELTSSSGTQVCVNSTNGLLRLVSECRDGEYQTTIGGGDVRVTQNGTVVVPAGEMSSGKVLPLTGVTVSGVCEVTPPPPWRPDENGLSAFLLLEPASGETMDAFVTSPAPIGGQFLGIARAEPGMTPGGQALGKTSVIVTSKGATATITVGGSADLNSASCRFLWQATEAPN